MIGLALMIHKLAVQRAGYDGIFIYKDGQKITAMNPHLKRREWLKDPDEQTTTAHYYRILVRLERGERP
jgi:hypothetical protein